MVDEYKLLSLREARAELLKINSRMSNRSSQKDVMRVLEIIDAIIKAIEIEKSVDFGENLSRFMPRD